MNRLHLQAFLMAGLAMVATTAAPPAAADSVRVPIRSANARTAQLELNTSPAPAPLSPTPLPAAPLPESQQPEDAPPPPPPVPDYPAPVQQSPVPSFQAPQPPNGGAMYSGPLGSDFQRDNGPKRQYLGDIHGPPPQPIPDGSVPHGYGQSGTGFVPGAIGAPIAGTDRYGIAPPAGTLGQTYQRRSRLIDDEKHPRVGIVEVHLSENYEVSAKGLKTKWTGKVWRLESDPLLPGTPHIYEVKSEWGPEGAKQQQIRTIRLIKGRIVDLEF